MRGTVETVIRSLLTTILAISKAGAVAGVIAWVASYVLGGCAYVEWVATTPTGVKPLPSVPRWYEDRRVEVGSVDGRLFVTSNEDFRYSRAGLRCGAFRTGSVGDSWFYYYNVWRGRALGGSGRRAIGVEVPWAAVVVASAMPPMSRTAIRLCRRRPPHGCRRCGYDLRATPGRCPECGAAAANRR